MGSGGRGLAGAVIRSRLSWSTEGHTCRSDAKAKAFLTALLLLTTIFGAHCATAAADDDPWDVTGMSIGFGGVYAESSGVYYDWCGPLNTLRGRSGEDLVPQYSVD